MVLGHIRRGERIEHFDTVRRRKDGTLVPISLTVSPIRDPAGTTRRYRAWMAFTSLPSTTNGTRSNLLRTVLEGAGASVATARSAPEAMDAIRQEGLDVLIADIGMPGMDGLQLIRAIRQMEEPVPSIPAAALSA
jgi:hypothetical protein